MPSLDHLILPFDIAQGGEPVEPFRIYPDGYFVRISCFGFEHKNSVNPTEAPRSSSRVQAAA